MIERPQYEEVRKQLNASLAKILEDNKKRAFGLFKFLTIVLAVFIVHINKEYNFFLKNTNI